MGFDFTNKSVIVTGASRGIGYAIAEAFCAANANVTVIAETDAIIDASEKLSEAYGSVVTGIRCDIADVEQVRRTIKQIDRIDILINNAGLELITPIADVDEKVEADFRRIIDINVMGTFYVTRYSVPKMPVGGSILITCSIWSRTAVSEFSAYCTSKHAVLGFMRSMSQELAPRGIRVNGVCPGWVKTEASMRSLREIAERSGQTEEDILNEILGAQSLPGLMAPADIADTYLYLSSKAANNITGQAVNVDRG
ncbi:MAG: SDR family NAD(P)-dependent oxidoreductase, partial [bacterium]